MGNDVVAPRDSLVRLRVWSSPCRLHRCFVINLYRESDSKSAGRLGINADRRDVSISASVDGLAAELLLRAKSGCKPVRFFRVVLTMSSPHTHKHPTHVCRERASCAMAKTYILAFFPLHNDSLITGSPNRLTTAVSDTNQVKPTTRKR